MKGGENMHNFMKVVIAFVLVFSFSGIASSADEKQSVQKTRSKAKQITGEVTEIDLKGQTVSVKSKNGTISAGLTDKTKVTMDKEAKTLGDVQAGDRVTMKYKEVNGKQTAKSIEIKSMSKKPKLPT
jgi:Cu/Ag efflux protein CusF